MTAWYIYTLELNGALKINIHHRHTFTPEHAGSEEAWSTAIIKHQSKYRLIGDAFSEHTEGTPKGKRKNL